MELYKEAQFYTFVYYTTWYNTVMQKHALGTPRNASKNKTILINSDIIHEVNGVYEFVDPAFELWFKKQFFNQNYTVSL